MAVAEKVKSIIVEQLGVDEEEVTPDASFVDDLGADSLDTVELVMAFEEEFGIEIPDEDAEKIATVQNAIDYIKDKVTQFDTTDMPSKIAGEIKGFDPADYIEQKEIKKMDRFIQLAVAASQMVMDDCALKITDENAPRIGTIVGAGMGGLSSIEFFYKRLLENGPRRVSPFFIPIVIINLAAGQIAIRFGLKGPNSAVATACASGTHAIGDAFKIIQRGDADAMVAGGSEACITAIGFAGFCAAKG